MRDAVVIIGDGERTRRIAESVAEDMSRVLVVPPGSKERGALRSDWWPFVAEDPRVSGLLNRSRTVIVAVDDDALSATISSRVSGIVGSQTHSHGNTRGPFTVVASSDLSAALRPPTLERSFPPWDVSNPSENVAQLVCATLQALATSSVRPVDVTRKTIGESDADLEHVLDVWLGYAREADAFLARASRHLHPNDAPSHSRVFADSGDAGIPVQVVSGEPVAVAASVLRWEVEDDPGTVIAITPAATAISATTWNRGRVMPALMWLASPDTEAPAVITINTDDVGLDIASITDGLISQWGRAYHAAHSRLYRSMPQWNATKPGRNEQSSVAAVKNMLALLGAHGFRLTRRRSSAAYEPTDEEVESMARGEHEAWLNERTWSWNGKQFRAYERPEAKEGDGFNIALSPDARAWEDLSDQTRKYNRAVTRWVYPAIAATFGYQIERLPIQAYTVPETPHR